MRISDWSSDVCSSDLPRQVKEGARGNGKANKNEKKDVLEHGALTMPLRIGVQGQPHLFGTISQPHDNGDDDSCPQSREQPDGRLTRYTSGDRARSGQKCNDGTRTLPGLRLLFFHAPYLSC